MPDTGAPYFIPYVEPTDLVRDYPAADEAQADAIAAALDAAGGLVAVKSAIFTGVQSESVASGANVAVTDLAITHEVADAGNRLIISAFLGAGADSDGLNSVGLAIHDGTSLIAIGDADGVRTRTSVGSRTAASAFAAVSPALTFVHSPGAGSKTYTVRAVNMTIGTNTLRINRNPTDGNNAGSQRAVSSLVIQEVKV